MMHEDEQRQVFEDWLTQHKGLLFKIVRSFAFTAHDQDDLFQDISLQMWKSIPDFRGDAKPSTWIYRVALYTATTWVRNEKKQPQTESITNVEHTLKSVSQPRDERLEWLYEQIAKLEPIDRSVCLLLLDGFSYKEIASLLGISTSNVGVRVHRIKQHLRRQSHEVMHHGV